MVFGTMTTGPTRLSRANSSLGRTLRRILSFSLIDVLYLNIPYFYGVRMNVSHVAVPKPLLEMERNYSGRFRILRCKDYGPATKLLPLLLLPNSTVPHEAMILTFDDDRMYTEGAVTALVRAGRERPDSVITIAAWGIHMFSAGGSRGKKFGPVFGSAIPPGTEGKQYHRKGPVDLLLGFYGVLYRKRFLAGEADVFDYTAHRSFQEHCAWVDDVWFSGHLERLGVPRYCVGDAPDIRADITDLSNMQALSLDRGVSVRQNHDNVLCAEAMAIVYGIWKHPKTLGRQPDDKGGMGPSPVRLRGKPPPKHPVKRTVTGGRKAQSGKRKGVA